jgi:LMBR1 domain-containing protein 1
VLVGGVAACNGGVCTGNFALFGVCAFAAYGFYLLWAVIKGNFKLGVRFGVVKIFPMEVGKTKMSAFLANSWVILLCSVPTVQFCVDAFPLYARETQVDSTYSRSSERVVKRGDLHH